MNDKQDLPTMLFASREAWQHWLDEHHRTSAGLWLQIAKQGADAASVTYEEALQVGLCYGWIDGQKAPLDDVFWLQRFTPRRVGSRWSKANRERVEALMARDLMQPAGLRAVELAKADGRWDAAYAGSRTMSMPDDLRLALEAQREAAAFFATLDAANRYAILYRVQDARRPETRARRIATFVTMLGEGRTIHPMSRIADRPSPKPTRTADA